MNFLKKNGAGLLLCLAISIPAWFLGKSFPVIGGPVFAILIGMVLTLILKEKERWEDLYTLYTTALGIETYEEWQLGQLDALIALGEYEKAYKTYEKRKADNPAQPVERITIVCMGHEPDLKASLEQGLSEYKLDIEIVDILRDKKDLQLKREAEAEIVKEGSKLVVRSFYPMNLMQKLSLQKEYVEDWRQLVESIMIDWNYDGVVMQPTITDVPDKKEIVSGIYDIPEDAGTIRVKITDLLSESLEMEVE